MSLPVVTLVLFDSKYLGLYNRDEVVASVCRPATTFAPLIFVLGVSMIKELVEDIKRYRADREINARLVLVFNTTTKTFEQRPWRDVKVLVW